MKPRPARGFTLIEVLIVIAIIATLATIVFVAIDPAKRFREANNATRQAHVNSIVEAIGLRIVDKRGSFVEGTCTDIPTTTAKIIKKPVEADGYDIAPCLVPDFLGLLPVDPKAEAGGCTPLAMISPTSDYNTCYTITKSAAGRITIAAPNTENVTPDISVTR